MVIEIGDGAEKFAIITEEVDRDGAGRRTVTAQRFLPPENYGYGTTKVK
jgi:hypothetical protein